MFSRPFLLHDGILKDRGLILLVCILTLSVLRCGTVIAGPGQNSSRLVLHDGWRFQPSTLVHESGEVVASAGFQVDHWYRAKVPSTILAALVEEGVYQDPYVGMNLRAVGGNTYTIGTENFMLLPMPPESPFRQPWWYRTEFKIPPEFQGKILFLHFNGINYRANIWLNGRQIAKSEQVAGTWRIFEI